MTPKEIAETIRREEGAWTISQMGRDRVEDLVWDHYPDYQYLPEVLQVETLEAVAQELFG